MKRFLTASAASFLLFSACKDKPAPAPETRPQAAEAAPQAAPAEAADETPIPIPTMPPEYVDSAQAEQRSAAETSPASPVYAPARGETSGGGNRPAPAPQSEEERLNPPPPPAMPALIGN